VVTALRALYDYSDEEGEKRFGENFFSAETLAEVHIDGAAKCDHIHDGNGFLNAHMLLTAMVESALQAVDPVVTIPYWAYERDGTVMKFSEVNGNSLPFTEEWFGVADERTGEISGVFGDITYPVAGSADRVQDMYGLVRAPWNISPNPKITRFFQSCQAPDITSLPTCDDFHEWLNMTHLTHLMDRVQYTPHGGTHLGIGGYSHEKSGFDPSITCSAIVQIVDSLDVSKAWIIDFLQNPDRIRKTLWREGYATCKGSPSCRAAQVCMCESTESFTEEVMEELLEAPAGSTTPQDLVKALNIAGGDQLTSQGAFDPQFHLTHTNIERLWSFRMLNTDKFPIDDWTWYEQYEECSGHNPKDTVHIPVFGIQLTNLDALELFDARNGYMPYVYDSLDYSFCGF